MQIKWEKKFHQEAKLASFMKEFHVAHMLHLQCSIPGPHSAHHSSAAIPNTSIFLVNIPACP